MTQSNRFRRFLEQCARYRRLKADLAAVSDAELDDLGLSYAQLSQQCWRLARAS